MHPSPKKNDSNKFSMVFFISLHMLTWCCCDAFVTTHAVAKKGTDAIAASAAASTKAPEKAPAATPAASRTFGNFCQNVPCTLGLSALRPCDLLKFNQYNICFLVITSLRGWCRKTPRLILSSLTCQILS